MDDLNLQIQRIKEKLQTYKGRKRLLRCLAEAEVIAFETQYSVRLPEEYRRFLIKIGNGEAFIHRSGNSSATNMVYGIKSHDSPDWLNFPEFWENLSKPFMQTEGATEYQELTEAQIATISPYTHGNLWLMDEGCGSGFHLIVTGPERGNIWDFWGEGRMPVEPRVDFLTWYENIVDRRLKSQRKFGLRHEYGSNFDYFFPEGEDGPMRGNPAA